MNDERIEFTRSRSEQLAWLETGAITISFPLIGYAVDRTDPLLFGQEFAWIALPPLLVGLRHGFVRALTSAAVLLAAAWLVGGLLPSIVSGHLPDTVTIGTLLCATLAGLFSDTHRRRMDDLCESYDGVWRRHQELARDFLLLEVSHERLVRQGGSAPLNLRNLLEGTESWGEGQDTRDLARVGQAVIELVENHGLVQEASVHAVSGGHVRVEAVAVLGAPSPVSSHDPLIRAALETQKLALVHHDHVEAHERSPLLAVVPFVDVDGTCHGILAIHAMPFIAFEEENLRLLSLLAGRVGDMMSAGRPQAQGETRALLERYIKRACQEAREHGSSHALAVISFRARADASELLEKLEALEVRSTDRSVLLYDEALEPVLCVVLPVAEWEDATVFQQRVDAWCHETLGQALSEAGGEVRVARVGAPRTAMELVREIVKGGMDHESPVSSLRTGQPFGG